MAGVEAFPEGETKKFENPDPELSQKQSCKRIEKVLTWPNVPKLGRSDDSSSTVIDLFCDYRPEVVI